jgi:hypothetical protein
MRKHVMMWWLAGGATVLGASLTYLATRPALAPVVSRAQAGASRVRESRVWESSVWAGRKLRDKLDHLIRRDGADQVDRQPERPIVRNSAFEEYRAAELARLEEEERAFHDYLERLRSARDREEFEAFMRDRQIR